MGVADSLYKSIKENGFKEIEEMVKRNESESIYVDYKFVATLFHDGLPRADRNKSADKISKDDKDNLGKAISGFANSDGGIIVWGVECKDRKDGQGDVPGSFQFEIEPGSRGGISPFPLNRFKALLEDCTKYCTVPVHGEVYHRVVPKKQGTEGTTKEGVVITYVKEAQYDVIRYVKDKNEQLYYMRVGSSFELMPHSVMAARFGRKPFPRIVSRMCLEEYRRQGDNYDPISVRLSLIIENYGKGVARDYYIVFNFPEIENEIKHFRLDEYLDNIYYETYDSNSGISADASFPYLISTKDSRIIPPGYKRTFVFILKFTNLSMCNFSSLFIDKSSFEDFPIEVQTGSSDSMPERNKLIIKGDDIFEIIKCNSILNNSIVSREDKEKEVAKIAELLEKYDSSSECRK